MFETMANAKRRIPFTDGDLFAGECAYTEFSRSIEPSGFEGRPMIDTLGYTDRAETIAREERKRQLREMLPS